MREGQAGVEVDTTASLTKFLAERLRLRVNEKKSAVDRPWLRKLLGYSMTFHKQPRLKPADEAVRRVSATSPPTRSRRQLCPPSLSPQTQRAREGALDTEDNTMVLPHQDHLPYLGIPGLSRGW